MDQGESSTPYKKWKLKTPRMLSKRWTRGTIGKETSFEISKKNTFAKSFYGKGHYPTQQRKSFQRESEIYYMSFYFMQEKPFEISKKKTLSNGMVHYITE